VEIIGEISKGDFISRLDLIVSSIASFLLWWEHFFNIFAYYLQWKTRLLEKNWEINKSEDTE
jgi:hypothetical protein